MRRPAALCRDLLAALEASEGRRQRRKRDTTGDAFGLGIKRRLLEAAVADDPEPERFEGWLLEHCLVGSPEESVGARRAMALEILHEVRLAGSVSAFDHWLGGGAPSDDRIREADGPSAAQPAEAGG